MVEIPDNVMHLNNVGIEPGVLEMLERRFPVETILMASIAVSLRRLALCCENHADEGGPIFPNPGGGGGNPNNPGHGGGNPGQGGGHP